MLKLWKYLKYLQCRTILLQGGIIWQSIVWAKRASGWICPGSAVSLFRRWEIDINITNWNQFDVQVTVLDVANGTARYVTVKYFRCCSSCRHSGGIAWPHPTHSIFQSFPVYLVICPSPPLNLCETLYNWYVLCSINAYSWLHFVPKRKRRQEYNV